MHFHYLKGMLYCGRCEGEGRKRRLVYSQSNGNGGTYEYWVCSGKQRDRCQLGSIRMDDMEAAVARVVAQQQFSEDAANAIREEVSNVLDEFHASDREVKKALRSELVKLEAQEERLIELAAEGTIASSKLRDRLQQVTLKKGEIKEKVGRTEQRLLYGAELVLAHVDILADPGKLYRRVDDSVRRDVLGAMFSGLVVHVDEEGMNVGARRSEVNEALHDWNIQRATSSASVGEVNAPTDEPPRNGRTPRTSAEGSSSSTCEAVPLSKGWNILNVVGMTGFEPATP